MAGLYFPNCCNSSLLLILHASREKLKFFPFPIKNFIHSFKSHWPFISKNPFSSSFHPHAQNSFRFHDDRKERRRTVEERERETARRERKERRKTVEEREDNGGGGWGGKYPIFSVIYFIFLIISNLHPFSAYSERSDEFSYILLSLLFSTAFSLFPCGQRKKVSGS